MQPNISVLAKKAIEAALKSEWQAAIKYNQEILEKDEKNIDAKLRLGRAYIQSKEFNKAKRLFEEVLKADPINQIALKNLKLALEKRTDANSVNLDAKNLIKEPGTTVHVNLQLNAKGISADSFLPGETLKMKVKKKSLDIFKLKKNGMLLIGTITDQDIINRLNMALAKDAEITAGFLKGQGKDVSICIKSDIAVFRAEKQDTKPYIKKGSIDEPELEIENELVLDSQ